MDDSSSRRKLREREKRDFYTTGYGKKRRRLRVCLCLRGPAENPLSRWFNTAAYFPLWQPTAIVTVTHRSGARSCLVFGVRRGCKRGAKRAQTERSQIQRPSIDVSLSSLGIYFGNSTGISSIMSTVNSWTECGVLVEKHAIFQMFNTVISCINKNIHILMKRNFSYMLSLML